MDIEVGQLWRHKEHKDMWLRILRDTGEKTYRWECRQMMGRNPTDPQTEIIVEMSERQIRKQYGRK